MADNFLSSDINIINGGNFSSIKKDGSFEDDLNNRTVDDVTSFSDEWTKNTLSNDNINKINKLTTGEMYNPQSNFVIKENETEAVSKYIFDDTNGTLIFKDETLSKQNEFGCEYDKSDEVPLIDLVRDLEILSAINRIPDFGSIYDFQVRQITFGVYKYANALLCVNLAKSLGYLSLDKIINDEYTLKKGTNDLYEKYKDNSELSDKFPPYTGWLDSEEYINGGWVDIDELVKKSLRDEFAYDVDWSFSIKTKRFHDRKRALIHLLLNYTSNIWELNSSNKLVDFGLRIFDKTSGKQLDFTDIKNGLRRSFGEGITVQFSGDIGKAETDASGNLSSGQPNINDDCKEKKCDKNYVNKCDGTIFKKDCNSDLTNTGSIDDKNIGNYHLLSPQFKINPLSNYRKDRPDILNTIDPINWTTGNVSYIRNEFPEAYKWIDELMTKYGESTYESMPLNQNRAFHYVGGSFDNGIAVGGMYHQNDITLGKELWDASNTFEVWNGTAWRYVGTTPLKRGLGLSGGNSNYHVNAWGVQPMWTDNEGEVNNNKVTPYAFKMDGKSAFYEYNNDAWTLINIDPIVEKHSVSGVIKASKTGNDALEVSNEGFTKKQIPNSTECIEACSTNIQEFVSFLGSSAGDISYKSIFSGFCFNGTRGPVILDGRNYCDDFDDNIIFFSYIDAVRSKTPEEIKDPPTPTDIITVGDNTIAINTKCSYVDQTKKYPIKTIGTCYVGSGTAGIATGGKSCIPISSCDGVDARTNKFKRYFQSEEYYEAYDSIVKYTYEWNGTTWTRRDDLPEDVAFHCGVGDEKWSVYWGGLHSSVERANVSLFVPGCDTWYNVIEAFNGSFNKYGLCGLSGEIKYAEFANTFLEVTETGTNIYRVPSANGSNPPKYYPVIEVAASCSSKFNIDIDIGVNSSIDSCPTSTTSLLGSRPEWGVKSRYIGNAENQILSAIVNVTKAGMTISGISGDPGIGIYIGLYDLSSGVYYKTASYEWTKGMWYDDFNGEIASVYLNPSSNQFSITPSPSTLSYTSSSETWDASGASVYDYLSAISGAPISGSYTIYGYNDYGGYYLPIGHRGHFKQTTVPTMSGEKMFVTWYESGTTILTDAVSGNTECYCQVCITGQDISASNTTMIYDDEMLATAVNSEWVGKSLEVDTEIYNYRYTNFCDLVLNNYHKNSPSEGGTLLTATGNTNCKWIWSVPIQTVGDEDIDSFYIKRSPVVYPTENGCEVVRVSSRNGRAVVSRAIVAGPESNGIGMYGFGKCDIADVSGSPFNGFFDYQEVGDYMDYEDANKAFPWVVIGDGGTVGPRGCVDMFDENLDYWFAVGDLNNKKSSEIDTDTSHINTYTIVMVPADKFEEFNKLVIAKTNLKTSVKSLDGFTNAKPYIEKDVITGLYTTNKTARNREGLLEAINAYNGDSLFNVYIKMFEYIIPDIANEDNSFILDSLNAVTSGGNYDLPYYNTSSPETDKVEDYNIITTKDISCLSCYTCGNDEINRYSGKNWIQHYHEEWAAPYIQHPLSGIFSRSGFNMWITAGDCPQRWGTAVWSTIDNGRVWVHYKKTRIGINESRNHLIYSTITSSFTIDNYSTESTSDIPVINKYDEFIFNLNDYEDDEFINKLINDVNNEGNKICEEHSAAFVPQSIWSECASGCESFIPFTKGCLKGCSDIYLDMVTGCTSGDGITTKPNYSVEDFDPDIGYTEWVTNFVMEYKQPILAGQVGEEKYYYKYNVDEIGSNCLKDRENINDQKIMPTSWRRYQDGVGLGGDAPLFNRPGTNFSCNNTMVNFIGQKAFGDPDRAIICGGYAVEATGELSFNRWFWNSFTQGPTFKWNRFVINPEDTVNKNYTYRNLSPFYTNGDQTLADSVHGYTLFDVSGPSTIERYGQILFNDTNEVTVEFDPFPDFITNKDKYSISLTPSDNVKVWWESKSDGSFVVKCEMEKWTGTVDWRIMYIEEIPSEKIDDNDSQKSFDGYEDK